jgi:enediyne polyketide synthase
MYLRDEANNGRVTPIAIVGAALAFPGACDPVSFHELTIAGRRMFRELAGTTPGPGATPGPGTTPSQGANGGDHAIAAPNGLPLRAALLERTERHLLARRTAAAALTDVPPEGRSIGRGRTGVIIADNPEHGTPGVCAYVREQLGLAHAKPLTLAETRSLSCSLRAVATACDALDSGALDLVLAGGVSMGIDPEWLSRRTDAGSLAAEDIRVYDVSPTGTLPGEGCGAVVLMRAADAQAAGLPVYAEIVGWNALEHAAPEGVPQPAAIRTAYLRAGVDPAAVQFVEGHGAAIEADDLAELTALLEVLSPRGGCALGAVSANIGDTRAAAGVAALLKTALAMAAGIIPPATGCVRPHPLLLQAKAPFRLPAEPEPWPETGIQLAAVNSLGTADLAGGVRSGPVHLVLRREQDPRRRPGRRRRAANGSHQTAPPAPATAPRAAGEHTGSAPEPLTVPVGNLLTAETVVPVGGADRSGLAAALDAIAITAERLPAGELRQLALELAAAPPADYHGVRAAIVASHPAQLAERAKAAAAVLRSAKRQKLRAWPQSGGPGVYLAEGARGRVALVFPGLASTPLEHTTMLSASMATLSALDRLGVQPRLAVGHSFGEITGLAWAGCITFGEAARLAAHRAEILRAAPSRTAMARVLADPRIVARLCGGTDLALAVSEGPHQQVLAGSADDIRVLLRRAAALGVFADVLGVACALHSSAMQPCVAPLRAVVAGMRIATPRRRLISTITGFDVTVSEDIPGLLAGQIARPALLAGALALASADADLILLANPEPAVANAAAGGGRLPVVQAPLERRSVPVPAALAALFAAGALSSLRPLLGREAARAGQEPAARSGYPEDHSRSQADSVRA